MNASPLASPSPLVRHMAAGKSPRRAWLSLAFALALPASALAGPLENLIVQAINAHPAVAASRERAGAAEEAEAGARWQYFPTPYVSAQALGSGRNNYYNGDSKITTVGLNQPLWTHGRIGAGVDKAKAGSDEATAALAQTRQQLAVRLVQIYGDWVAGSRKREAYEKGQLIHERMFRQVKRRIEEGIAPPSDRILAEARLASLKADLAAAETQTRVGQARLEQLLGRPLAQSELDPAAAPLPARSSLGELLAAARARHPALQQYRAQARAQQAAIAEREADLWPEISLKVEHQQGSLTTNVAPGTSVFVALSSRLGAGLSTWSGIAEARRRYASAEADVQAQERDVIEQLQADHALLAEAAPRRQALQEAVAASAIMLNSWDRQFLAGRKSWLDLMNSARELTQVEAQLADVVAAELVASWRLALLSEGVEATLGLANDYLPPAALPAPDLALPDLQ